MKIAAALLLGYALGSIPFGYIIGRLKKIDLKTSGSGNIGATNVGRVLGPKYFLVVLVFDGLKGMAAVKLSPALGLDHFVAGAGAILGHIFTPFLKFRGGKGVATAIGVFLGLFPKIFLLAFATWIVVYLLTFFVSLASLAFALSLSLLYNLINPGPLVNRIIVIGIGLLIFAAHIPNIERLLKGTESKTILWRKK